VAILLFNGLTTTFVKEFVFGLWLTSPLLLSFSAAVTVLGQVVGKEEGWSPFESFYWSFITATTVGYGDVRPIRRSSRVLSIVIALVGLILTGIVVAVAIRAATLALAAHEAVIKAR
jgi:voltage-gated potassium channel